MLKKLLIGLLVVIVGAFVALQVWVAAYKVTDPARAEQIQRDSVSRIQARDALGQDAAKNGYTDLENCLQRTTPAEVKAPYQALEDWSYPCRGKKETDVLEAYGKNATKIQEAVNRFETVLPTLDRALAKPNFIWPSQWEKGAEAMVPSFIMLRAMAQNLVGYSEYCLVTGKPARALHYILGILELGGRVAQNGVLISCMIGIAIDGIALEGAFQILGRSPALAADDYRKALSRLEALPLTPQTMLDRMDEEYVFQVTCVDQLVKDPKDLKNSVSLWPVMVPGYLTRERKVLTNLYLLQRPSIEKLHHPSEDGIDIGRAIQESHSILATILVPNTSRAIAQFRFTLAKVGGLKLLCALQLYKLEKGSYPETLDGLVPGVLKTLPQDYVSQDGTFVYKKLGDDFQLSSTPSPIMAETLSVKGFSYHPPEPRK